jgi:hypothetical protein
MFKNLKSKCGQGMFAEYTITFFLVVGVIMAMSVYVRRAIQGRIFSAHSYVFKDVNAVYNSGMNFQGGIWAQYEPYYINSQTYRAYTQSQETRLLPGGRDGIVEYQPYDSSAMKTNRQQASPEFAD